MATDTTIEAARSRIQRLVEEIAALSKADLASEEFFRQYIQRVTSAIDAEGGAVWLLGSGKGEFQLLAQTNLASSQFQTDETQRASILSILSEVMQRGRPAVLPPENPAAIPQPAVVNRTPFAFLHVPLFLKGKPLGVLQLWLKPYVQQNSYAEFVTFLTSLAAYVEQHLQSKQLGNLVLETQRLQHLLRFSGDLAGTLDFLEVARLTANYARDILGCERCSVLLHENERWSVVAISGQETVEKKSALAKGMVAFVQAHSRDELRTLDKKELLDRAGSQVGDAELATAADLAPAIRKTDAIDLNYFEISHVISAALAPLLDPEKKSMGILFCESTIENFFGASVSGKPELPAPQSLAQWIAGHSGRALAAARDYQTIPLLGTMRRVRGAKLALTGKKRNRLLTKIFVVSALLIVAACWPMHWKIDGNCVLIPIKRGQIVSEIPARIESIAVREGQFVRKGEALAQLDTRRLRSELEIVLQEKQRFLAESDRYRAAGDQGSAQIAILQSKIAAQNEEKVKAEIASATLRAPFDGTVITKDIEFRTGEFLQPGSALTELAALDQWELQIEIPEKNIGLIESRLASAGSIDTNFILYTQSAHLLHTKLSDRQQISAAAYPKEKESVFIITIPHPDIPEAVRTSLRPGLTGRAKLELGRRPMIVVVTDKIARWFRMKLIG